jgi:hypothetical protein
MNQKHISKPVKPNARMEIYICTTQRKLHPQLHTVVNKYPSTFINTREMDDMLCEHLKNSKTQFDGYRRWIEVHRSIRIRIITKSLIEDFGYIMWSGKTRKVLFKPD